MTPSPDFEALLASVRGLTETLRRFADVLDRVVRAQLLMAEALKTLNDDLQETGASPL